MFTKFLFIFIIEILLVKNSEALENLPAELDLNAVIQGAKSVSYCIASFSNGTDGGSFNRFISISPLPIITLPGLPTNPTVQTTPIKELAYFFKQSCINNDTSSLLGLTNCLTTYLRLLPNNILKQTLSNFIDSIQNCIESSTSYTPEKISNCNVFDDFLTLNINSLLSTSLTFLRNGFNNVMIISQMLMKFNESVNNITCSYNN